MCIRDRFYCGIPTRDQGFVFTGFSSVYLKGDQVYVVKTNAYGDTLWTQTQGGDHQDYGYCILEDITSGYASLGHSWSYTGYESMGYLVRLNDDGDVTWYSGFGDTGEDYARWFDQNPDHSFNIVGSTQSYGNGMDDFWLVFTNEDGTPTSWYTFGGSGADKCYNGSRDVDGGILMAGHTWSFGLDAPNMFLVKAAENGDSLWALDWGDQDWEYAWDVKPTLDGGYVLLGRDYSISSGDNNIVLVKYGPHPSIFNTLERRGDLNLPIEDEQTTHDIIDLSIAPSSTVSGVTVYVDTIMHGQIRDLVITLSHGGVTDTLLINPQAGGANMLGTVFHPAAGCDAQAGIAPMSGMYIPYRSTTLFNGTPVDGSWELRIADTQSGNTGTLEAWGIQVYYQGEVGIEEGPGMTQHEVDLYVYPNPASEKLYCKILNPEQPGSSTFTLEVIDIHGKMLKNMQMHGPLKTSGIDISDLPQGLYFIKLSIKGSLLATQKFMIAR
jgi:subtilisin-like proprotein convertase family protein